MLSYRHAYHAGNHADVLKHAVYAWCIEYLTGKPKPLFVLDTHAGAGLYDLRSEMAAKVGEWRGGVGVVWPERENAPELFRSWLDVLKAVNPDDELAAYPGSPELANRLLRPGDRLRLCELHPTDHALLEADAGVEVLRMDGFRHLTKAMPPPERRGVVLIDPSYELKDDYIRAADSLIRAHRRFATGTYLLWYPVVDREMTEDMLGSLEQSGMRRLYRMELAVAPDRDGRGMTASGVIVVNPPWTLPDLADEAVSWLASTLGEGARGEALWLVGE